MRTTPECVKTTVFPRFFLCFKHIELVAHRPKNDEKSLLEPFEWTFSRRTCQNLVLGSPWLDFGSSWATLGRHLADCWALLGGSWPLLGTSGTLRGRLQGGLKRFLLGLKRLQAAFWLSVAPWASILQGLAPCRAGFWKASEACFRMRFDAHRAS